MSTQVKFRKRLESFQVHLAIALLNCFNKNLIKQIQASRSVFLMKYQKQIWEQIFR